MSNYLILGGGGFIGQNLANFLASKGHEVLIIDKVNNTESLKHIDRDLMVKGRVKASQMRLHSVTSNRLSNIIRYTDCIIHLANMVGVDEVTKKPQQCINECIGIMKNLISANKNHHKPIFFASTSEVYGSQSEHMTEESPIMMTNTLSPRSSYVAGKLAAESMLIHSGQPFVIGRLFNVSGPYQSTRKAVIPKFISRARNNMDINVAMDDIRAFIHVYDVCKIIYKLMDLSKPVADDIFNIGNPGNCASMGHLANIIFDRYPKADKRNIIPATGKTYIGRRVPNVDKLVEHLGIRPKLSLFSIVDDYIGSIKK